MNIEFTSFHSHFQGTSFKENVISLELRDKTIFQFLVSSLLLFRYNMKPSRASCQFFLQSHEKPENRLDYIITRLACTRKTLNKVEVVRILR